LWVITSCATGDYPQVAAIATATVFLTAEDAKHAEKVVFDPLCGLSGLRGKMWVITRNTCLDALTLVW
jgi:hypothetical protein